MLDWLATREERREQFPGDEMILETRRSSTHAITIHTSPKNIWPWLVQLGCDRAGYYSYDRLDNAGRPSADRILPQFQDTKVSDTLPSRPGSRNGFEVLRMEPETVLLLGAYLRIPGFVNLPWNDERPRAYLRSTWLFLLRERDGETRLVVRARGIVCPRWLGLIINSVMGPAHVIMQRKQLLNLRVRAERRADVGAVQHESHRRP